MKVEVRITRNFKKQVKSFIKKYPSLLKDLEKLEKELINNPKLGKALGNNAYKVRLAIKSKAKGKSGGARIITLVENEMISIIEEVDKVIIVYLLSIYDKSEMDSISDKELKDLIKNSQS